MVSLKQKFIFAPCSCYPLYTSFFLITASQEEFTEAIERFQSILLMMLVVANQWQPVEMGWRGRDPEERGREGERAAERQWQRDRDRENLRFLDFKVFLVAVVSGRPRLGCGHPHSEMVFLFWLFLFGSTLQVLYPTKLMFKVNHHSFSHHRTCQTLHLPSVEVLFLSIAAGDIFMSLGYTVFSSCLQRKSLTFKFYIFFLRFTI